MDALAAGGLLAYFYAKRMIERARKLLWLGAAVGLVTMGVEWWMTHGTGLAWVQAVKYCSAELLYVSIIGLLIGSAVTPVHRFLRSSPMRAIGRVSYGMYVFHPVIFGWIPAHLGHLPLIVKAAVSFAAVYLVSLVSFYGFERRFTMFKDRLAPEGRQVDVPIFAPVPNHSLAEPAPLRMMEGA
jgi:peptidoglycan/LPS O-acetylase OafA/YrhL